jgi:hypothetical protein
MSNTVAIVAITSGATLGAAAITALAGQAQTRQRRVSEREQTLARFSHERSLHDVDELRLMLDVATEAIHSTRELVAHPTRPGWLDESLARLTPIQRRLELRLGADHKLAVSAGAVVEALKDIEDHYASVELRTERDEDRFWDTFNAMRDEVAYCTDRFLADAQETVGTRLSVSDDVD